MRRRRRRSSRSSLASARRRVPGSSRAPAERPAPVRRASSTRPPRPGSTTPTTGEFDVRGRRRRRRLRLRRRRPAGPVPGRRRAPGGAVPERERRRRRAPVRRRSRATHRPDRVNGAYPLDVDGDGLVDLAVLRVGRERRCCAASATAASSGRTRPGLRRRRRPDDGVQRDLGGLGRPADAGDRQLPRARRRPASRRHCADSQLLRPAATATGYGATDPAGARATARCRCSSATGIGSGRRDLRVSNDRALLRTDGRSSSGGWPRRAAAALHGRRRLGRVKIGGMGIASHDLTGDGFPEVYLTSQGDNKLQTLAGGPAPADLPRHRARARRHRDPPFTGGDALPSTAWHPEFQDVNNDGFIDLFVSKGNVDDAARLRHRDPSNLLIGQPDGTFIEGAEEAGIVSFAAAAARPWPTSTSTACSTWSRSYRGANGPALAQCRSRDGATPGADGPLGRAPADAAGPEPRRDRGVGRGQGGRPDAAARGDRWWRPRRRPARLDPLRPGAGDVGRGPRQWPDGESGRGSPSTRTSLRHRARRDARPWQPP